MPKISLTQENLEKFKKFGGGLLVLAIYAVFCIIFSLFQKGFIALLIAQLLCNIAFLVLLFVRKPISQFVIIFLAIVQVGVILFVFANYGNNLDYISKRGSYSEKALVDMLYAQIGSVVVTVLVWFFYFIKSKRVFVWFKMGEIDILEKTATTINNSSTTSQKTVSERLKELQDLKEKGLISEQEYNAKKSELLKLM